MTQSMADNIVLLAFNRPEVTQKTFEVIRQARPKRLFFVADGPRDHKPGEAERCETTRSLVLNGIDWPCELLTNLAETNMGCRRRVSSAITWAFEHVEHAIVLEDDCIVSPSFFPFCKELLERYEHDERVMHIAANNLIPTPKNNPSSYIYSRYPHCWGWATWRRAWQHYDAELTKWEYIKRHDLLYHMLGGDLAVTKFWTNWLTAVAENRLDSWATIWTFSCWAEHGLSILPRVNMVENVGFDAVDATHTHGQPSWFKQNVANDIPFPLTHPQAVYRDAKRDFVADKVQYGIGPIYRLKAKLGLI